MIEYIKEIDPKYLADKKILVRVNLDVPVVDGKIAENFRIKSHKEIIDFLLGCGAKIMLISHLGHEVSKASFLPVVEQIGEILNQTLTLVPHSEIESADLLFQKCPALILDNLRQDPREVENDAAFAQKLTKGFDLYANDAFAVVHREHSSVVAVAKHLPSYAGPLIKKEIDNLERVMGAPAEGKIIALGGAKIPTKMPVIKNFIDKAEKILVGGALANDFFRARGINIGASLTDNVVFPDARSENIILPRDFITGDRDGNPDSVKLYKKVSSVGAGEAILDIGPETAEEWAEIIRRSRMVIWNGPMGYCEVKNFEEGTEVIAGAVAKAEYSVIGGGDTIAAADRFGLLDKYSFVSTGGGAMLEFLAGKELPGLKALETNSKAQIN
ncbi:MAG: phosphoglycerate kinase [Candidatus Yanofskybacteria bacterium]|nr:phosphoglycerate kinase [Candidatus Yanofskybacteria bacterium]